MDKLSANASEACRSENMKTMNFIPVALLCIFLLTLYPSNFIFLSFESDLIVNSNNDRTFILTEYDPYSPFQITSNLDFSDKASTYGWDGTGSVVDPYIITNINVTLETDTTPLVRITDTDVHFIINSSLFVGGLNSIHFENVTNGVVSNNSIWHADMQGIYLRNVMSCSFDNNFITENGYMGLLADNSMNCNFTNNLIEDNSNNGAKLRDSPNNLVKNNTFAKNREHGLVLGNSPNCDVIGNVIHSNWDMGISVEVSTPVQIINNSIYENTGPGVSLVGYAPKCNVTGNTFYRNGLHGLRIMVNGTQILRNNFIENEIHAPGISHISDTTESSNYSENFWSEYTSPDSDHDDIVDVAYHIYGGLWDDYPKTMVYPDYKVHILTKPNPIHPNRSLNTQYFTGMMNVTWGQSSDTFEHDVEYSLEYSTNETTTWTEIATELTNTKYQFNTSILPQNTICNLKVIAECMEIFSERIFDSNLTIRDHTLSVPTVQTPLVGEVNQTTTIGIYWARSIDSWDHSVSYDVYYSPDGGLAWKTIGMSTWDNHYDWGISASINGTYLIKIIAYSFCGLMSEDISDSFNISRYEYENTGTPDVGMIVITIGIVSVVGIAAVVIVLKRKGFL